MRTKYIEYIKQKGVENVNVSHMIAETVPKGVGEFLTHLFFKESY